VRIILRWYHDSEVKNMKENRQRLAVVDGIRGCSLLGILLANMLIFQYGIWGKDELHLYAPSAVDVGAYALTKIFVEGSFLPIFAFLFGFGLIKMKESLQEKGLPYRRYFVRRFLFLMLAGFLHSTYLWEGDILFCYGAIGFFLLLFVNRKQKTVLVWGVILLVISAALSYGSPADAPYDKQKLEAYVKETMTVYGSGTYAAIKDHRNNADPLGLSDVEYAGMLFMAPVFVAPMFLFGIYAAKARWFHEPDRERPFYRNGAILCLLPGVVLACAGYVWRDEAWSGTADVLGNSLLAFGYLFALAYVFSQAAWSTWLHRFASVGKLSMTNYLMQTVICTTIFYGYGLGLFGNIGVLAGILLAVAIFAVQAAGSHWYMSRFRYGPVEKLLRMWTNVSFSGRPKEKAAVGRGVTTSA
jgi:uncharacterized protein